MRLTAGRSSQCGLSAEGVADDLLPGGFVSVAVVAVGVERVEEVAEAVL
jgi:hypothetical protein